MTITPHEVRFDIQQGCATKRVVGATNSSCAATVRISRDPASAVRRSSPCTAEPAASSAVTALPVAEAMEQEQRGDRIAGAVHRHRQARRAQQMELSPLAHQQIEMIARRVLGLQAGQQHAAQSVGTHRGGKPRRPPSFASLQRAAVEAGQPLQLEPVGRGDVGLRQGMVAQEFLDALAHIDAFLDIADHRIAAIDRARVRLAARGSTACRIASPMPASPM